MNVSIWTTSSMCFHVYILCAGKVKTRPTTLSRISHVLCSTPRHTIIITWRTKRIVNRSSDIRVNNHACADSAHAQYNLTWRGARVRVHVRTYVQIN